MPWLNILAVIMVLLAFWLGRIRGYKSGLIDGEKQAGFALWQARAALLSIINWRTLSKNNGYDVPIEQIVKIARQGRGEELE